MPHKYGIEFRTGRQDRRPDTLDSDVRPRQRVDADAIIDALAGNQTNYYEPGFEQEDARAYALESINAGGSRRAAPGSEINLNRKQYTSTGLDARGTTSEFDYLDRRSYNVDVETGERVFTRPGGEKPSERFAREEAAEWRLPWDDDYEELHRE